MRKSLILSAFAIDNRLPAAPEREVLCWCIELKDGKERRLGAHTKHALKKFLGDKQKGDFLSCNGLNKKR
jgi:hypothetical protein